MEFEIVLRKLLEGFEEYGIRCAAIGGYALGFWGVARATGDVDFLVVKNDIEKLHLLMSSLGYKRIFSSENVSQYQGDIFPVWGYVDFLHAFRPLGVRIVNDAVETTIFGKKIKTARAEDIIGLKLQALCNSEPGSRDQDRVDIKSLVKANRNSLDWTRIEDYYKLFKMESDYRALKEQFNV